MPETPNIVVEYESAAVVVVDEIDGERIKTRHEDVHTVITEGWVVIQELGQEQVVPRHRVEEVYK